MAHRGQSARAREAPRRRRLGAAALAVLAAACTPEIGHHGHMADAEDLERVRPGATSRAQVRQLLGSPSATSAFGPEIWYYMGKRISRTSFLDPEVIESKAVAIRFDEAGVVREVDAYGKADLRTVALVERETPAHGRELSLVEQLLGNIGRFGAADEPP